MRRSINISNSSRKIIADIKRIKYPKLRITDSYIINEAVKFSGYKFLSNSLLYSSEDKNYQSIKYTLDYQANDIISKLMTDGFTADDIIHESLEQMKKIEIYKRRAKLFKDQPLINVVGTNGCNINLIDYLPVIYSIAISNGKNQRVLYVGQSKLFASRESIHVVSVFDDPSYLGLSDEDLFNKNLSLVFSIEREIDLSNCENMSELNERLYRNEAEVVHLLNPALQEGMIMKKNIEKRSIVESILNKLLNE